MDLFEALFTRRSVRKYTEQPVSDADLHDLLDAAMHAPSAMNEQPWHFLVAREQATRTALSRTSPYTHMAADAPLVIVVCGDRDCDKASGMWVQDCSAATQNLLLAARGKNLGSVWCAVHPEKDREDRIRSVFGLPGNIIPFALVCIGHTDKPFKEEQRFREERVHMEKW